MSEKSFQITPSSTSFLFDHGTELYLADQKVCVQLRWGPWDTRLYIGDIADAMKTGKTCQAVTIEFRNKAYEDGTSFQAVQEFLRPFGTDFRRCLTEVLAKPFVLNNWGAQPLQEGDATFHLSNRPGMRTYSPFGTLAPLAAVPAKWTVPHAMRALWNGQFKGLKCKLHLTDDYAGDAASNFGKGEITNARAFCKQIIESPSGWRASGQGESISVDCHSFDYNSFTLQIAA
jgi:hypothetical protein